MKTNKYGILALAALLIVSLAVCGGLTLSAQAAGTTYYVDCAAGDDGANGTSTSTAWRTTTRANQQTYGPGDQILFKRGTTCAGDGFKPTGDGTEAEPITVADYGSGDLPVIDGVGEHEPAILLLNVKNYVVQNLDLTHEGQTPCTIDNKHEVQSCPEGSMAIVQVQGLGPVGDLNCGEACTVRNVHLDNLVVHDGTYNGIYVMGGIYDLGADTYGFADNVLITNVEVYNVMKNAIEASCTYFKTPIYATTNVQVLDSYVHDNGGDGVVYGPVAYGLVDGVEASYNGLLIDARLGVWTWDSLDTTMQFCESHHNMTPDNTHEARDGGGFDCDLGSEDCMLQYNWSHDNEGEGYLLMTWPIGYGYSRGVSHNIQMRYNLSERDAYKLAGPVDIFGGVEPAVVYNNTIYYVPTPRTPDYTMVCTEGAAWCSSKWGKSGSPIVYTYNNIFINDGTIHPEVVSTLAHMESGGEFYFDNNLWWRVEGGVHFQWGSASVDTWADWQALGFDLNGMNADPLIVGPLGGGPAAYQLQAGSPAIDAAREVTEALRGMGPRDYFGVSIPQGAGYDIGMAEYGGGPPPPTNTPGGPTDTPAPPTDTPGPPTDTPTPVGGTNLALNQPTEVSSFESASFVGANAVDGDVGTLWRSKKKSGLPAEWIQVDLGGVYQVGQVTLRWDGHWATVYAIEVSENGSDWSTVYSTASGDGLEDVITFAATPARYVKMNSTGWENNDERCWLQEFEVYGSGGPGPTDTPEPPPTDTPEPPPTDTPEPPPTDTPEPPPTDTPEGPTDTPVPPTDTPVPPTDTPVPPTDTPEPPPTDTPIPPPTNTPGAGELPFFDGFEDGEMSDWSYSGSVNVMTESPYQGTYHVRPKNGGSLWRTVSTAGSTGIHLKYAGLTHGLDAGEYLEVEWYDGSAWTSVDQLLSEGSYILRDWTLPAGAEDNSSFAIRFTCVCDKNTEWGDVDNIEVTGQ